MRDLKLVEDVEMQEEEEGYLEDLYRSSDLTPPEQHPRCNGVSDFATALRLTNRAKDPIDAIAATGFVEGGTDAGRRTM